MAVGPDHGRPGAPPVGLSPERARAHLATIGKSLRSTPAVRDPIRRATREFGILGAAILAAGAGCSVIYLGSDLPAADIIDAAIRSRAHTVVLGLIYEEAMRTALADVRRNADRLSDTAKVCVGGAQAAAASRAMKSACATLLPDFEAFEAHLAGLRTPAGSPPTAPGA